MLNQHIFIHDRSRQKVVARLLKMTVLLAIIFLFSTTWFAGEIFSVTGIGFSASECQPGSDDTARCSGISDSEWVGMGSNLGYPYGFLHVYVFFDRDGNGIEDDGWGPDLPWENAEVGYTNSVPESDTGLTGADGVKLFREVRAGIYSVGVTLPQQCEATTPASLETVVPEYGTAYVRFGLRCTLFLPLVMQDNQRPVPPLDPIAHPKDIAVDEERNHLFVSSKTSNRLYESDAATGAILRYASVGAEPYGVALNASTGKIYVANYADGTVSVIDATSLALLKTISFGWDAQPTQIAINPATNRIFVTLHGAGELAMIEGAGDTIVSRQGGFVGAYDVVVDELLNLVYVTTRDSGTVEVVDGLTNNQQAHRRVHIGGSAYSLALDPVLRRLFVIYAPYTNTARPTGGNRKPSILPLSGIPGSIGDPSQVAVFAIKPSALARITTLSAGHAGEEGGVGIAVNSTTGNVFVSDSASNTGSSVSQGVRAT